MLVFDISSNTLLRIEFSEGVVNSDGEWRGQNKRHNVLRLNHKATLNFSGSPEKRRVLNVLLPLTDRTRQN
jgi:hypothetical protein